MGHLLLARETPELGEEQTKAWRPIPRWVESHLRLIKMEGRDDVWREGRGGASSGMEPTPPRPRETLLTGGYERRRRLKPPGRCLAS